MSPEVINYLLGVLGIVISVVLFLVGYRQTIGARTERIGAANTDLLRVLMRRIVLESYTPTSDDIDRLREGKAREYRIAPGDILLPIDLMNGVFTQILENDFIAPDPRREILERVNPLFEKLSKSVTEPEQASGSAIEPVMLALFASLGGALGVSVVPNVLSITTGTGVPARTTIELATAIIVISFSISSAFLIFKRFRDSDAEPTRADSVRSILDFEKAVAAEIASSGLSMLPVATQSGYDFAVTARDGRKILIEAKSWGGTRFSRVLVAALIKRLVALVSKEGASEAWLVTKEPLLSPPRIADSSLVKLVPFRELKQLLSDVK